MALSLSINSHSEGKSLTKEDEKSYWGKISYEEEEEDDDQKRKDSNDSAAATSAKKDENGDKSSTIKDGGGAPPPKRLQVKGSVIYGWGLEPIPVARFIMREATELEMEDDEDDDDDDDDFQPPNLDNTDGQIDWTDAFQ